MYVLFLLSILEYQLQFSVWPASTFHSGLVSTPLLHECQAICYSTSFFENFQTCSPAAVFFFTWIHLTHLYSLRTLFSLSKDQTF